MIPDAPFILSLAGLNASVAGLGGLLIGLRRASGLDSLEALRLRQVVEFAFANLLLAIAVQPLALLLGDPIEAVRILSAVTLAYVVVALIVLDRRVVRVGIAWGRSWAATAVALTLVGVVVSAAAAVRPTSGGYELVLVAMLARPIAVFLLVLRTLEEAAGDTEAPSRPDLKREVLASPPSAVTTRAEPELRSRSRSMESRDETRGPESSAVTQPRIEPESVAASMSLRARLRFVGMSR